MGTRVVLGTGAIVGVEGRFEVGGRRLGGERKERLVTRDSTGGKLARAERAGRRGSRATGAVVTGSSGRVIVVPGTPGTDVGMRFDNEGGSGRREEADEGRNGDDSRSSTWSRNENSSRPA